MTGAEVELDPGVRLHRGPGGALLVGGQPLRVLRLSPAAGDAVQRWRSGDPAVEAPEQALASRLHALGVAVVRPRCSRWTPADVTVVVPVRDRPAQLDRCLAALGACARVVVVDDGSRRPLPVARVAARHRADLLVRPVNGGPAAARNTGLAAATTPLVCFVDSDCQVPPGWLADLLPALDALDVAAVGPRVVGAGGRGRRQRFETASGPLDLGDSPGPVDRGTRVGHLPAAVLLCRREAVGAGFDPSLRVGEDVDLVWRLAEAGWSVRYEPRVEVRHDTREHLGGWLRQRVGYGRSAALLDARHPGRLAPVVISRWSLPALACLAARRPGWALACTALSAAALWTRLPTAPGRPSEAARLSAQGLGWTVLGVAEAAARPWLPALLPLAVVSAPARRLTAAAVVVRLVRGRGSRAPGLGVAAWASLRVADDLAYACGVWSGAVRSRRAGPLLPRVA